MDLRPTGVLAGVLPAVQRPHARLAVLDISEYYSETSGGVRTYLDAKGRFVANRPTLRRTLVVPGRYDAISEAPGDRTYRLRGPAIPFHSYRFLLATRSVARIIAHERPDIVEIGSAYFVPWVVSRARRRHPATVAWFYHSNIPRLVAPDLEHGGRFRPAIARAVGAYVNRLGRLADVTLAASNFAATDLASWGVEHVERVTLGVDTVRFNPSRRAQRPAVLAALCVTDGPLVGFVGRLASEKQVDVLLRAWPAIERRTGATLVLVGDGPQASRLRALAGGSRVRMVSYEPDRDRLANLLAACDLYVSPAPYETFGLAVCEALASGVPVLSVDHGAAAELVRGAGTGGLVPRGDSVALAEAAIALLESDLAQDRVASRAYVERHHTWEAALINLFDVYARLRR